MTSVTGDGLHSAAPIFSATGIVKRYQSVQALADVDIAVFPGEVHALLGQNGAGKSTLVRIIAGAERPDSGEIVVGGRPLPLGEPLAAASSRIAYVSQEGSLNPFFTVPENVFLGREVTQYRFLSRRRMRVEVAKLLDEFGLELDLDRPVSALEPAKRKIAEIVRALALRPQLLILDEPTAALPQPEVRHLLSIVRRLASESIGVLFISHYLEEVFDVANSVTVLRDGRRVFTGPIGSVDSDQLVQLMIGKKVAAYRRVERVAAEPVEPAIVASGLATADGVIKRADLSICAGRILGIFGVVGAGKSELLEALYGLRRLVTGEIAVAGRRPGKWNPREAIAAGLALVPEDRMSKALLAERSIAWNAAMPYWSSMSRRRGISKEEARLGQAVLQKLGIRASRASVMVSHLSGGNKQKVSIGRWLGPHSKAQIFLCDEPTQGLDVGAREEVYELMRDLATRGAAIVVATSDLEEALALADDVVVIRGGTTTRLPRDEHTPEALLSAAT